MKPIFKVFNHHVPSCGTPPEIDGGDRKNYYGYFENMHGEQAIFVHEYSTKKSTLYLGDAGWDKPYEVSLVGKNLNTNGLILNTEETMWLLSCFEAIQ